MFTVTYMSETGELLSKEGFKTLEDARLFCEEISSKNIPIKNHTEKLMTRSAEIDMLLENNYHDIRKYTDDTKLLDLIMTRCKLEIEKDRIRKK